MSGAVNIVTGTINNLLNREEELFNERIKICRQCKLLRKDSFFGEICNSRLWLNPTTNEISYIPTEGYTKGCGCILSSKTRVKQEVCPARKW